MSKIYSTFMLLAMIVAAMSFSSCSSNTEIEPGSMAEDEVLMIYNGVTYKMNQYGADLTPQYLPKQENGAEFVMKCPFDITYFKIVFPRDKFGEMPSKTFKVGDSIGRDGVQLLFSDATSGTQIAQYLIGSAQVVANDGQYISIAFESLKATTMMSTKELSIIKGTIKFKIVDDYK